ncbi:cysteine hydrolase family protein [Desulfatirhabdium butyrativorans]|uniref:cysteine hydrolase family protein n=1 Tax=Desulfatirhabdium butyrativorans TaxID=340467 RepID=UPI0004093374|nr:cysteine hydrolase family protein [Desulfatirhabdium butyrativorans]
MKTCLLIVDPQNDFCNPKGSLFVPGADQDAVRLGAMIDRVRHKLNTIKVTMDSHHRLHVAHPIFWRDPAGNHPSPFTIITKEDVREGRWMPFDTALNTRALDYTEQLEQNGRYQLCIWPEHCLMGTWGQVVVDPVRQAILRWEERPAVVQWLAKGSNIYTEHYSVVQADVPDPADPHTELNMAFLKDLQSYDVIGFTGEALSHCVANTGRDIVANFATRYIRKIHLITDCSSSVSGFAHIAESFLSDMKSIGMQLCTSAEFLK